MKKNTLGRGTMLVCVALMLPLGACYEHTFTVGAGAPYAPVVEDDWQNFWLGGLIGHYRLDVEHMCPSAEWSGGRAERRHLHPYDSEGAVPERATGGPGALRGRRTDPCIRRRLPGLGWT